MMSVEYFFKSLRNIFKTKIKFIFISNENEKDDNIKTNYYILVKDIGDVEILGKTNDGDNHFFYQKR